jgi:hypothetical protein
MNFLGKSLLPNYLNKWFKAHRLSFDKNHFIHSQIKTAFQVVYDKKLIAKAYDTKFLGIYVGSTLSWNAY